MAPVVLQSGLLEMVFSVAVIAGTLLLFGGLISFGVFLYKSIAGDGIRDPREVAPEKVEDDDELTKGDPDDEWDYY